MTLANKKWSKKGSKKARKPRKASVKFINKVVDKRLKSQSEPKQAYYSSGNSLTYFNSGVAVQGDMLQILPNISKGDDDNSRDGDQIVSRSININGYLKFLPNDTVDNSAFPSVIARVMIVSLKNQTNYSQAINQTSALSGLLKKGGTTTGFTGILSDINAPVNTDLWTVHHDKKFYLNQSYVASPGSTPGQNILATNIENTIKFFNFTVKCKNKKLLYDANVGGGILPVNFSPMMLIGYSYLDGSTPDTLTSNLGVQYISTLNYIDQ